MDELSSQSAMVFEGFLRNKNDLWEFADKFSVLGHVTDKASQNTEEINRRLWYDLTGGVQSKSKNKIFIVRLPFLMKAVHGLNKRVSHNALVWNCSEVENPHFSEKDKVILFSGMLFMQIKEKVDETSPSDKTLWNPPRDFAKICSDNEHGLESECYVEVYVLNMRYVAEFKDSEIDSKPSFFDYVLDRSPALRQAWDGFKETFLDGGSS